MMNTFPTLFFVFLVLAYSFYQGSRQRRSNADLDGFFIMNKQLYARALGASFVGSSISVATVVLALGVVGYTYGFWAGVWLTICWVLGTLLFSALLTRPKMRHYLKVGHTLHEFIGECYDQPGRRPYTRLAASFLTLLVFWGALGIEFFAGVIVFTKLAGTPSPLLIALIIAITIVAYTVRGGYRAATLVDYPRLVLVGIGFIIIGGFAFLRQVTTLPNSLEAIFGASDLSRFDSIWAAGVFFSLVPVQLAGMDMWQRCVAAGGDVTAIRRGLIKSLPLLVLWLIPAYVGSLARTIGDTPTNINYVVLNSFDYIAPLLGDNWWKFLFQPLIYGSLVATMASVCDTLLMSMIFTFMYDIYGTFKGINYAAISKEQEIKLLSRAKYWTGILGLSSVFVVFIGLFVASLYDLIIASFAVQIVLFWPALFAVLFPEKEFSKRSVLAFLGLVTGASAAGIMILLYVMNIVPELSFLNSAPIVAFFVTFLFYLILLISVPKRQVGDADGHAKSD